MGEQSKLERAALEIRATQNNEYDKEERYGEKLEEILDHSKLKENGREELERAHPGDDYMKHPESPYAGTGYNTKYEEVYKGSKLRQIGIEKRAENNPVEHLEMEFPNEREDEDIYNLSKVKKGDPADGGHVHTIPSNSHHSGHIIPQIYTANAGDKKDVETRERLMAINKYNRTRAYSATSIDTTENMADGQYFIP